MQLKLGRMCALAAKASVAQRFESSIHGPLVRAAHRGSDDRGHGKVAPELHRGRLEASNHERATIYVGTLEQRSIGGPGPHTLTHLSEVVSRCSGQEDRQARDDNREDLIHGWRRSSRDSGGGEKDRFFFPPRSKSKRRKSGRHRAEAEQQQRAATRSSSILVCSMSAQVSKVEGAPPGGWNQTGKLKEMARRIFKRAHGLDGHIQEDHDALFEEVRLVTGCSSKSYCELIYGHSYASDLTDLRDLIPGYRPKTARKRDAAERGKGGTKKVATLAAMATRVAIAGTESD
jgi:hypothetical protein